MPAQLEKLRALRSQTSIADNPGSPPRVPVLKRSDVRNRVDCGRAGDESLTLVDELLDELQQLAGGIHMFIGATNYVAWYALPTAVKDPSALKTAQGPKAGSSSSAGNHA